LKTKIQPLGRAPYQRLESDFMRDAMKSVKEQVAKMGAVFNADINDRTRALYAPLISASPDDIIVSSDIFYGRHPRQTLDLYRPRGVDHGPVLLFVPGGGFVAGDKNLDALFYSNVGRWFARRGIITVLMNYRLAPDFPWPAGGTDVRDAVEWIHLHADDLGGDPSDFTLFAQSAGAAHAASYLFHPDIRSENVKVARAVLASGIYDLSVKPLLPSCALYYGSDETRYSYRSAIAHVHRADIPILLSYSEFDPPCLAVPTLRLAEALASAHGKVPRVVQLGGHNHVSNVLSFGSGDDNYGNEILAFAEQDRRPVFGMLPRASRPFEP
jgi:arylformamidase